MAECAFRDHSWLPDVSRAGTVETVSMTCGRCGVGHRVAVATLAPGRLRAALTVFPAHGSTTISRAVIRWSILSHEANLSDLRAAGVEIMDDPATFEGTPVGD